ncbi:MAG TPA: phosphoglycerate mutase family protein [Pyrinomonadaceae bacterium]|jgi:broad specificity phosphatase PhoE|nr:phosphoglycerate mutase family protein [Pyrinomonadaceae bacterium]
MKRVAAVLLILLALGVASCGRQQSPQGSTVVLVVRHADKASDAEDSPLSDVGSQRAQALAGVAVGANVGAIYVTQFKRNHDTARPLAERTGVAVTEVPVSLQNPGDYGQRLARDILDKHRGQTVLVVGHGNTVASIVEGLTGRAQQLGDIQYGDLLIVTIPPSGPAGLIRAQYGAGAAGGGMMMK